MARKRKSAEFDITTLASGAETVAAMPGRQQTAPKVSRFENNPFVDLVRASYNDKMSGELERQSGRQVVVAAAHVKETAAAIRDAADKLANESIGVRLVFSFRNGDDEVLTTKMGDLPDNGDVTVLFEGNTRKRYLTEDEQQEARQYAFVNEDGKIESRKYLAWVKEGRPMEDDAGDDETVDQETRQDEINHDY